VFFVHEKVFYAETKVEAVKPLNAQKHLRARNINNIFSINRINCIYEYRKIRLFENHTKNVWVLFKKPKLVAIAAKQKNLGTN
jgi:hypothetical protein